jgi:hypothetical protein
LLALMLTDPEICCSKLENLAITSSRYYSGCP